jgi:hypothetical protein
MKFGYLIIISSSEDHDYLKMAYALALTIKNTQKLGYDQVALVTDNPQAVAKLKSSWVFDHVIDYTGKPGWDNRSWMDLLSPFDATVCLDADMIFTRDVSHWVDHFLTNDELYVANTAYTYRGELINNNEYRKTFVKNQLPNLYSFFTFFKKDSELAKEFFTLGRYIIEHPTEFSNLFLLEYKPKIVGTDEAFSLSAKLLDIQDQIAYPLEFLKIVHLKPLIQNWPWPANKWSDHVGFYLNKSGKLKIGNYQQTGIIHYVEKDKINNELVSILEEIAWKK